MKYLLDSNTVSDIYNPSSGNHHSVIKKLLALEESDDIFISVLTLYEFEYAFANSPAHKKAEIKATIQQIQQDIIVLPLSPTAAEIFGDLKKLFKGLRKITPENLKKHTIDLMIAASALNHKTVLVSADKIYKDIISVNAELVLEDWTI
jgi:predicted nucleic acid-binding protein